MKEVRESIDTFIPREHLVRLPSRDKAVLEYCANKKVLHIGAADWPYTEEKYNRGSLLYVQIGVVAKEQLGVDMNATSVEFLQQQDVPNSRIEVQNMNELSELSFESDVIVFGETLEHLMNLAVALQNLRKVMKKETRLVISVPNTFYFMNFVYAFFKREHQHPDHSVAFTYKTLVQLLQKNNLTVEHCAFTFLDSSSDTKLLNWKGKIMYVLVRIFSRISPLFAETLFIVARR